ncbi:MAG TPA: peptidase U32, partial [Ruminococcaceae bacterium]|nr:peptidase U32 [Oscillospiraceae bacterium]
MITPELLAPAGDLERLEAAVRYGADAVYLGSTRLGMRSAPQNFDIEALTKAVQFCHENGKKVYLTANILAHNRDLRDIEEFFQTAKDAGVDALIISDLGIFSLAKKYTPEIEIHVSTQMGVTNHEAANALYRMGAKRVVLARELSLEEIAEIRAKIPSDMEIECFIHGAMCVSFSGRCLLSNYLTGRDSNHGDCAQPCRWQYALMEQTRPGQYFPIYEDNGTYIMNSNDMCMIEHIPELVKAGITSFKIEGRAKSAYYTAVVTNAYRAAIDGYLAFPSDTYKPEAWITDEMVKMSNRGYCTGFFFNDPKEDAHIFVDGGYKRDWCVAAIVDKCENGRIYLSQRNRFFEGDEIEILSPGQAPIRVCATG